MPSHSHYYTQFSQAVPGYMGNGMGNVQGAYTATTGGNQSHTHGDTGASGAGATGSSGTAATWRPLAQLGIICKKS